MSKQRIITWLEAEEVQAVDDYAQELTKHKQKKEEIVKPPSKRGRQVSRSKACRSLILEALQKKSKEKSNVDIGKST